MLTESDEIQDDAVLRSIHRFAPCNAHDFLACTSLFEDCPAGSRDEVAETNRVNFLHAANRQGFALPHEHPPGPLADVADAGHIG
jgi:hypothetical protein